MRAGGEGATEDEMVGWHHRLNGHEYEQTPGDGEGQRSLGHCSPWGRRVAHTLVTKQQGSQEELQPFRNKATYV